LHDKGGEQTHNQRLLPLAEQVRKWTNGIIYANMILI